MNRSMYARVPLFVLTFVLLASAVWSNDGTSAVAIDERSQDSASESSQDLEGVIYTLDRFMLSGKEGDPRTGASLLDMYETSPRKAEEEIRTFYERRHDVFSNYVSISNDIYGFEIKEKGYKGPNIELDGRIETAGGFTAEFSARLVFRDERWRILKLEID